MDKSEPKKKVGRKPTYDYKSEEFLKSVEQYAKKGFTDKEIAYTIGLNPTHFCEIKNKYPELSEVLSRGRRTITAAVRAKFFAMAMGGVKVKNKSVTTRKIRLSDGTVTDDEEIQTTETENELPPSLHAQSVILYHYDEEWRKVERKQDEDASDIPSEINQGVNIESWIKKEVGK
nr:hypothetical protein [uncultured Bacteroides sp.]